VNDDHTALDDHYDDGHDDHVDNRHDHGSDSKELNSQKANKEKE